MEHGITFFSKQDLEKYSKYAGTKYNYKSKKSVSIANNIKDGFFEKTRYWLNRVLERKNYKGTFRATWQYGGVFSQYTWAKIFIDGSKDSLIFFTIGVNLTQKAFIIKLDCQRQHHSDKTKQLSKKQKDRFDNYLKKKSIDWNYIYADEWSDYNWDKLIEETLSYIDEYSTDFKEIIDYTKGNVKVRKEPKYQFITNASSKKMKKNINSSTFKGKKIDWNKLNKEKSELGLLGEEFVVKVEKDRLGNYKKKIEHISQTEGDGAGYDILSYDGKGNKKHIEVKTTCGGFNTPFYLTEREKQASENIENYFIYRVYDFDFLKYTAKIQELDKRAISKLKLEPIIYKTNL